GSALTALRHYPWPGNVRQLRSTIRRAALLADSVVMEHHLDITFPSISAGQVSSRSEESLWKNLSYKEIVRRKTIAVERAVLSEALKRTAGNKARAARILQIDYKTLHTKLKQLGIQEGIDTHFKFQSSRFEVDG
ncbi:MAG TPA: helix-turn-helix domain-containing protein, partial [Thermodesulfobacteriota bacterium]|nr:helix-turn-helix domain-containing protein [Thermodesulfobacteriota bacterium]